MKDREIAVKDPGVISARAGSSLFFTLSAIEGIIALQIYLQPKETHLLDGFQSLTPMRLLLVILLGLIVLVFAGLGAWEAVKPARYRSTLEIISSQPKAALFIFIACASVIGAVLTLAATPLGSVPIRLYYLGWRPIFIWITLMASQIFILAVLVCGVSFWLEAFQDLKVEFQSTKIRIQRYSKPIGLAMFGIAFLVGLAMAFYGQYFVDESENFAGGWLVSKGYLLYKDLFTHHFPFPYYWIAAAVRFLGNSVPALRVSLLILQFSLLGISMGITRLYFPLGLTALAWTLSSVFHFGNQVLYDVFSAVFIVSAFVIILSHLVNRRKISSALLVYLGFLVSLAILSDPLMVYPGLILVVALYITGWTRDKPGEIQEGLRRVIIAGGTVGIVTGTYMLYLTLSGTLDDFYQTAIVFNSEVYGQYVNFNPNRISIILRNLLTGLDVFNSKWRENLSFAFELNDFIYAAADTTAYYGWIYTSFTYRLAVIVCSLGLLLRKRYAAGLILYTLSASLLVRVDSGFHTIPLILLSLFAASYVISCDFPQAVNQMDEYHVSAVPGKSIVRVLSAAWWALRVITGILLIWGGLRSAVFIAGNYDAILDRNGLVPYQILSKEFKSLACGQPEVELSYFPYNSYINFRSEIPPVSKYIYMLPWVADIGLEDYLEELRYHPSAIVYIDRNHVVWDKYPVEDYLDELITFLDENYILVKDNTWVSPELAEKCQGIERSNIHNTTNLFLLRMNKQVPGLIECQNSSAGTR